MGVGSNTVQEIVKFAVEHDWSIPEFQRGFVWKPTQVRELADSLYRNYPIGSLLLWNSPSALGITERAVVDAKTPTFWLVDGQQRASALAILFRRRPYWWDEAGKVWNTIVRRFDIRFDVERREFVVADAVVRQTKAARYVPVPELMQFDTNREADQQKLAELAQKIKSQGLCADRTETAVYTMLDSVTKIRQYEIPTVTTSLELEDVVQVFGLLNQRGTRVAEADVYLAIVASKPESRTWVRSQFLTFISQLREYGFEVPPKFVFQTLTAVGTQRVRFKDIDPAFWAGAQIKPAWDRTVAAWKLLVRYLQPYGILSDFPLPTQAALITLVALVDKFRKEPNFGPAVYWLVQASRLGRYSAASTTALEQDLGDISESGSFGEAVDRLCRRLDSPTRPFIAEDFRRDYLDGRFGRFLLYLLAFDQKAQDWDETSLRLGFDGGVLARDYRPQFHHVFPAKYLDDIVDRDEIDQLANIAVIGPKINIKISAKSPMRYLKEYKITNAKLAQQFIDGLDTPGAADEKRLGDRSVYDRFIGQRAERLAAAANEYVNRLLTTAGPGPAELPELEAVDAASDAPDGQTANPIVAAALNGDIAPLLESLGRVCGAKEHQAAVSVLEAFMRLEGVHLKAKGGTTITIRWPVRGKSLKLGYINVGTASFKVGGLANRLEELGLDREIAQRYYRTAALGLGGKLDKGGLPRARRVGKISDPAALAGAAAEFMSQVQAELRKGSQGAPHWVQPGA